MISENIAGSILATKTQRHQWYNEFNTGYSLMVYKLNLKTLFAEEKYNHLHAMLCQETSDIDKKIRTKKLVRPLTYLPIVRVRSENGACVSPYICSFEFCPY